MFTIFKSVRKIIGLQNKVDVNPKPENKGKDNFLDKTIAKTSSFVDNLFQFIDSEHKMIKEKMKNLYQSNYDLGLKHLKRGNVKEAIFRFRIIKKFWPNNYDAYYQLIYCLMLNDELAEAQKVIDDLLTKNPSDKERINKLLSRRS